MFHFSIAARKTSFHAFGHFVVSHGIERLLQKYIFFEFTGYFPLFLRKMRDMPHSLLPFNNAPQYISYKHDMHEPIRYVLDHLDEWQLIWYGSKVPRERIMWIEIYAHYLFL